MSVFSWLANTLHSLEQTAADYHHEWWLVKNRNEEVVVEFRKEHNSEEYKAYKIHKEERLSKSPNSDWVYQDMKLHEAIDVCDNPVCEACFAESWVRNRTI